MEEVEAGVGDLIEEPTNPTLEEEVDPSIGRGTTRTGMLVSQEALAPAQP